MTKRSKYILDKSIEITDLKETYLSIQISLDGFSFCIYNPTTQKYLTLQQYDFERQQTTPEILLEQIQKVFDQNNLLAQQFKKVNVVHHNELATLVPHAYFDEAAAQQYLERSVKVLKNDYISHDTLEDQSAVLVYIPYVNINNFIFSKFGSFDYFHMATLFIEAKNKIESSAKQTKYYIHVHNNTFYALLYKSGELLFFNHFKFQTAADFIYYVLFVIEQTGMDPDVLQTELSGDIEKESELFKNTYQYIRHLNFYTATNPKLTDAFSGESKHSNYIILQQF